MQISDHPQRSELTGLDVVSVDLARLDFIVPGMQLQRSAHQPHRDSGMRLQVFDLREDVFLDGGTQQFLAGEVLVLGPDNLPRGFGESEPRGGVREFGEHLGFEQPLHRSALRMAANDDVLDIECADRIFDGRRFAAIARTVGRNNISRIAQDKQITRRGLRDQVWINARIAARDEHRIRRLAGAESFEEVALDIEDLRPKMMHTRDKLLNWHR